VYAAVYFYVLMRDADTSRCNIMSSVTIHHITLDNGRPRELESAPGFHTRIGEVSSSLHVQQTIVLRSAGASGGQGDRGLGPPLENMPPSARIHEVIYSNKRWWWCTLFSGCYLRTLVCFDFICCLRIVFILLLFIMCYWLLPCYFQGI